MVGDAVVSIPDSLLGNMLAAALVPIELNLKRRMYLSYVGRNSRIKKVPQVIRQVSVLTKNSSSKVDRKQCEENFQESSQPT